MAQDSMPLLVDGQQQLSLRVQRNAGDVRSVCEGKSVRFVVYEVEDGDTIADGREQAVAIFGEDKVALAIDRTEKVGELGWY